MLFRLLLPLLSTVFTLVSACTVHSALYSPLIYTKYAQVATTQYQNPVLYPHVTTAGGQWRLVGADWWTTGFFPGSLYLLNTRSKRCPSGQNVDWLAQGRRWSNGLIGLQQGNTVGHDTGFLAYPFVEELAVNPNNQTAIKGINDFARLLANRYSPITGLTKSWDSSNPRDFLVIIDNMMNLEVLFISAELTGNNTLKDIAISHADKTMQNHLRPDGSSYHVVNYDSTTGTVIQKRTAQGYSNESTWTRGQAWGIYGFAMMYSRTKFPRYLDTARKMGKLFVSRIPSPGIIPWDFDAPASPVPPADTSAAALASSAFLMLSTLEKNNGNNTGAVWWADAALKLLADTSDFAASPNWWQAILTNGTSNNPANPPVRDTGLVYGDYYYIKAGNQLLDMGLASCRSSRVWSSDQSVLEGETYQLESVAEPGPTGESDSLKLAKRRHRTRSHHKHRTPVDPVFPSF